MSSNIQALMEAVREVLDESELAMPTETYGPPPVTEADGDILAKNMKPGKRGSGKELEKKARKKRGSIKKLGSGRNPFRHKDSNGPARAVPPVKRPRNVRKKADWKCKCGSYKCLCKNIKKGYSKLVRIRKNYKKQYNASYKRWRKNQTS